MFGIDSSEFLVIVIIAVIVIGPKDLPRALYKVGQIVGKAQGMARHFRTGLDAMVREVELEELEKKWAAQNKRIMDEHPPETANATMGESAAPAMEALPDASEHPPYVAQSAPMESGPVEPAPVEPVSTESVPVVAADGPPYLSGKGGAAA